MGKFERAPKAEPVEYKKAKIRPYVGTYSKGWAVDHADGSAEFHTFKWMATLKCRALNKHYKKAAEEK